MKPKPMEQPTCHLVKMSVLVFGWKDRSALLRELVDGMDGVLLDYDDLSIEILADTDEGFPHANLEESKKRRSTKKPAKKGSRR